MPTINALVVDLSHWDPADDYAAAKQAGIVAVIFKATEGQSYTDPTYTQQQKAAKAAGLLWGSYHFADASDVNGQINNYLRFAAPDPHELFCLDWEDNPTGNGMMSVSNAKAWIMAVENALDRPGQCVIYSGNTAKEQLGASNDSFFGARRLWLAQYATTPSWQTSWDDYWLWQFTDGEYGPLPHSIPGIGNCDINSYPFAAEKLIAEWATGMTGGIPIPPPAGAVVSIDIKTPPTVRLQLTVNGVAVVTADDD